jgi:hypothetical protein
MSALAKPRKARITIPAAAIAVEERGIDGTGLQDWL